MPVRQFPLATGEFYHIINRGVFSSVIFKNKYDYDKFLQIIWYYRNANPPVRFSKFLKLTEKDKNQLIMGLDSKKDYLVNIVAYCLMPNHYHFLLKQSKDKGIVNFMRLIGSSLSHYLNLKYQRRGSSFEGRFKAIRIESNDQLLHLSRYIHLNPYSSFLVKDLKALLNYNFSSLPKYLNKNKEIINSSIILDQFKSINEYKKFILDQADYQKNLQIIKHQLLEK